MGVRTLGGALALLLAGAASSAAQSPCPGAATLTVFARNLAPVSSVRIAVNGELAPGASGCAGQAATAYATALDCDGTGLVRCGTIPGLHPGAWIHRLTVEVPGSPPQHQAERAILVAGAPGEVSNALVWTVYPKTAVVDRADPAALWSALGEAGVFTAASGAPALVTFSPAAFPGAEQPQRIALMARPCVLDDERNRCRPGGIADGATAGLCFTGDRIVVDALDADARPGAVVLSVDTCGREAVRLYGAENVLRGLVLEGSRKPAPTPPCQVDTLAIVGPGARGNRIEQTVVLGPTCGDAVSVQSDAGAPDASGAGENVIVASRIAGAADKGVKIDFGAVATVADSCVHDNRNGGLQSTLGGHLRAARNVVQHNVPGAAQNGISVGGPTALRSTLATDGNVVRFAGGRGLSVVGNAEAAFANDYVADSQFVGARVEPSPTAPADRAPQARFHGVALVCNRHEDLTGTCAPSPDEVPLPCTTAEDCCTRADGTIDPACLATAQCQAGSFPSGFGAVLSGAADRLDPDVAFGDPLDPGRNAFSANQNTAAGANLRVSSLAEIVSAEGNQWERCGTGATCDVAAVLAGDVVTAGTPGVAVGTPPGPRAEPPLLDAVRPSRPQAGDVVRVFGRGFNAIEGNPLPSGATPNCADLPACAADGSCPVGPCVDGSCPCAIVNPAVEQKNQQTGANRIRLKAKDGTVLRVLYPDAVTPTMLAFHMPFDCYAPLVLEVAKRDPTGVRVLATMPLCDPMGCADAPAGTPCDDGDACTTTDACDGAGACLPGPPRACDGPCLGCEPALGCVPLAATARCDDGDACTTGDHCRGDADVCVAGRPVVCGGQCLTGACDPAVGCEPEPAGTPCSDGDACTAADACSGDGNVCLSGPPRACDAPCHTGACDPAAGCVLRPATASCEDGDACTTGDHCAGSDESCLPGEPRVCAGACLTGACEPATGCVPAPAGTLCRTATAHCDLEERCDGITGECPADAVAEVTAHCEDGDACTTGDHCSGLAPVCVPGAPRRCDGRCESGLCDPDAGCLPAEDLRALTCRAAECPRRRLGRRARKLAAKIDRLLDRGDAPRARQTRRLAAWLRRCGVTLPAGAP